MKRKWLPVYLKNLRTFKIKTNKDVEEFWKHHHQQHLNLYKLDQCQWISAIHVAIPMHINIEDLLYVIEEQFDQFEKKRKEMALIVRNEMVLSVIYDHVFQLEDITLNILFKTSIDEYVSSVVSKLFSIVPMPVSFLRLYFVTPPH